MFIALIGFLLLSVFGTAAGGFLIMLYDGCTSFVAGTSLNVFSLSAFIDGVLIFFPIMILFVPMFLFLSLIRHGSQNKISGAITVIVLSLAVWIFLVPVCFSAGGKRSVFYHKPAAMLSPRYFRKIDGSVWYFTKIRAQTDGNSLVDGIKIDEENFASGNTDDSAESLENYSKKFSRDFYGFSDPLVGENLCPPKIMMVFLKVIFIVQQNAFTAWQSGTLSWILFSSIMAALLSAGAVLSASEWRLASALYVIFDTFAIMALNYFYFTGFFIPVISRLNSFGRFFNFLTDNFQLAINICLTLSLTLFGFVKGLVHARKRGRLAQ